MSMVVAFAPMNLRLYDKDERELRTYVSPIFECTARANDEHGLCAHIVADNGGGKSTLLLFFELLFCRSGSSGPNVGKKKVIDYLRRAAFDLHDSTPTTMAALVRKDDPSVMRQARDVIFGYSVGLRDAEGTSTDLRRFVIHLAENPGYSLERLANEVVYDSNGMSRSLRDVCDRLRSVPGCRMYDGSEWDDYVHEMVEAGISPILWRELAKMNAEEEAAGTYFQSSDAFRNIARLISEAQAPVHGEQAKPLWDVAASIARRVAAQAEDREREQQYQQAGEAVRVLSEAVHDYGDAREELKVVEDRADADVQLLRELSDEISARITMLHEREETYKKRRYVNNQRKVSSEILAKRVGYEEKTQEAELLRDECERKRRAYDEASKRVVLDDAARSYRQYKRISTQCSAKEAELKVLKGNMAASEELAAASKKAWKELHGAEAGAERSWQAAEESLRESQERVRAARTSYDEAEATWAARTSELGGARNAFNTAARKLEQLADIVDGAKSIQKTIDGFYVEQTLEALVRDAVRSERRARELLAGATEGLRHSEDEHSASRDALEQARIERERKQADADVWAQHLAHAREMDDRIRKTLALWEEPLELVAEGRVDEAIDHVNALAKASAAEEAAARTKAEYLQRRIDALDAGRLDMSDQLRRWLDRHEIEARTLASYAGIPAKARDELFQRAPWLAHVLVVDDRTFQSLSRATDKDELSDLGHPVFYMRQSSVHDLVTGVSDDEADLATKAQNLVRSLHTLERAYLTDPETYGSRIRDEYARIQQRAENQGQIVRKLGEARDEVVGFKTFLISIGLDGRSSLAQVVAREEAASLAYEDASARVTTYEQEERRLHVRFEIAKQEVADAEQTLQNATKVHGDLVELKRQNEECIEARRALDDAESLLRVAETQKRRAQLERENAESHMNRTQAKLDAVQREKNTITSLRLRLEDLAMEEERDGTILDSSANYVCSSVELSSSVQALQDIVSRNEKDVQAVQAELEDLRERRKQEDLWQRKLRDSEEGGVAITMTEIEESVPSDDVERNRLVKEERRTRVAKTKAEGVYQKAENDVLLAAERLEDSYKQLARLGLQDPIEVPEGYDYDAEEAAILADSERDNRALQTALSDERRIDTMKNRLRLLSDRQHRNDAYRAKDGAEFVNPADFDAWEKHVVGLEERGDKSRIAMLDAETVLVDRLGEAVRVVGESGELATARGLRESTESMRSTCTDWASIDRVRSGLEEHSRQFRTMAATLRNKLRATDESIEDLANRAVSEGYRLLDELHHLVVVSKVSIKDRRQRSIDFRSRGRSLFLGEVRRDEVMTNRLERYVRKLMMEELPALEDASRTERAHSRLEPHELAYVMLDDRSIEVRYPVIRGGRGLSYESARDVMGSGSTGQKSAGYVLAFLALLRYLGSVGSLSSEKSQFAALENQFGKISSSTIIQDIKSVVEQTNMQLITVAGRELRSAYAMGDVVFTLYRTKGAQSAPHGSTRAVRVQVNESEQVSADAVIDKFRATRQFENLRLDI